MSNVQSLKCRGSNPKDVWCGKGARDERERSQGAEVGDFKERSSSISSYSSFLKRGVHIARNRRSSCPMFFIRCGHMGGIQTRSPLLTS